MTKAEWAAIMLWCKKNGFQPWGNNNYGKDSRETLQQAIPATYGSGTDAGKFIMFNRYRPVDLVPQ